MHQAAPDCADCHGDARIPRWRCRRAACVVFCPSDVLAVPAAPGLASNEPRRPSSVAARHLMRSVDARFCSLMVKLIR
eukprot:2817546-Pyramimonas_sp.AAC.2